MAYQTIPIAEAVKAGIQDSESRGAVWDDTTYTQGLKFANDGRVILVARSVIAALQDTATWSTAQQDVGEYSALLTKTGAGADVSAAKGDFFAGCIGAVNSGRLLTHRYRGRFRPNPRESQILPEEGGFRQRGQFVDQRGFVPYRFPL